jgi:predicted amino acid racemase
MPRMKITICFIKVRGVFRLRNVNIVGFYYLFNCFNCYMFRSYDNLQVDIFSRIYSMGIGLMLVTIVIHDYI